MSSARKTIVLLLALITAGFLLSACGGGDSKSKVSKVDDPNPDNESFHVGADATTFGGPAPLAIRFKVTPFHATGPVFYRWRFDDGTYAEGTSPVHTFTKPGYYQVLLEARDERKSDAWNLIVGAWPPKVWEARTNAKGPVTKETIRRLQKAQGLLTAKRRKAQLAASKRRAAQYHTAKPAT
jgi:hypothetical protein